MILIPAIDLQGGDVVQLVGGDPEEVSVRMRGPIGVARNWLGQGAGWLHIVDLDRALGRGDNRNVLRELLASLRQRPVKVQIGGGLRTMEEVGEMLDAGAHRAVVGTRAVTDPEFLPRLVQRFGGKRIVVAVDARDGMIVVKGWTESSGKSLVEFGKEAAALGVAALLYTDVGKEGRMAGVDTEGVAKLCRAVDVPVIASGGIGSTKDLLRLRDAGAWGAVAGMALYTGRITFQDAVRRLEEP